MVCYGNAGMPSDYGVPRDLMQYYEQQQLMAQQDNTYVAPASPEVAQARAEEAKKAAEALQYLFAGKNEDGSEYQAPETWYGKSLGYAMSYPGFAIGAGVMGVAGNRKKVFNGRNYTNYGARVSKNFHDAKAVFDYKHPFRSFNNYHNLEFAKGQTSKLEVMRAKYTPNFEAYFQKQMANANRIADPALKAQKLAQINQQKALLEKLSKAKCPAKYNEIVKANKKMYKNLCKHLPQEEVVKLKNAPRINHYLGSDKLKTLTENYKQLQEDLKAGRIDSKTFKTKLDTLHKQYSQMATKESRMISQAVKAGNAGELGAGRMTRLAHRTGVAKLSRGSSKLASASKFVRNARRGVGKAGGWIMAGMTVAMAGMELYGAHSTGKSDAQKRYLAQLGKSDVSQLTAEEKRNMENLMSQEGWANVKEQAPKTLARAGMELGGCAVGSWLGGIVGQVLIPIPGVGAAIGAAVGSALGMWGGAALADTIPYTREENSVIAQSETRENRENEEMLAQSIQDTSDAIDADDGNYEDEENQFAQFLAEYESAVFPAEEGAADPLEGVDEQTKEKIKANMMVLESYAQEKSQAYQIKKQRAELLKRQQEYAEQQRLLAQSGYASQAQTPSATPSWTSPEFQAYVGNAYNTGTLPTNAGVASLNPMFANPNAGYGYGYGNVA